jgi:hypothetical protein
MMHDQDTKHRNNITGCFALASGEDLLPNGDLNKSNHFNTTDLCRMASRLTMSESYDEQVNHVRIIDRQVNDARIIGPETMDSLCSLVSSVQY